MKKFRKLVPAFAMLLVSATVLASTTFAWFSMNNKVTASGLEVTAKANTQYLVIGTTLQATTNVVNASSTTPAQAAMTKTTGYGMTAGSTDIENGNYVYPVSKAETATSIKDSTGATISQYTDGNTVAAGDYFTANSPVYGATTGANNGVTNVSKVAADFTSTTPNAVNGKYFLAYSAYLGLAAGSDAISEKRLSVKLLNNNDTPTEGTQPALDGSIRVVVVVGSTVVTLTTVGTDVEVGDITIDNATPANANVPVKVFVYIDGYGTNVHDGATAVTGKIGLEFTVAL